MASPLLQLNDIALTFGGTPLLSGAELSVGSGERVSLVGRNGAGKSTLLKIAAGLIEPDRGSVFVQPGAAVALPAAGAEFFGLCDRRSPMSKAGSALSDDRHAARRLLEQVGLTGKEDPAQLSGGEARRAALAAVLAPSPDILLLDEPTNHLDLTTIEWLERDLDSRRIALVIISHDRRFLSTLSRSTVWLDRGQTRRLERGFGHFEEWRDALLAEEERDQHKLDRKIVAEEHWMRYGVTGTAQAQHAPGRPIARVAGPAPQLSRRGGQRQHQRRFGAAFGRAGHRSRQVSAKAFDGRPIVGDFSIRIQRGDRIGIVGPNGSGKTTLINMLTGVLLRTAARSGSDRHSPSRRSIRTGTVSIPMSQSPRR